MKINHIAIKTSLLLLLMILCLSLAKEGIIHSLNYTISSCVIWFVALISSGFTTFYSIKIILYCFIYFGSVYSGYVSLIVPGLTLSSLLIDESFYYVISVNLSFCESLLSVSFSTLDIKFSIVFFLLLFTSSFVISFVAIPFPFPFSSLYPSFSSNTSFFIPLFQDVSLIFSSYWCSAPIHCIEVFTGYSSGYSYYLTHYFSNLQFISFILFFLSSSFLLL